MPNKTKYAQLTNMATPTHKTNDICAQKASCMYTSTNPRYHMTKPSLYIY